MLSAITGLGESARSREDIGSARDLAIEAVAAAIVDAGVAASEVDGLLIARSPSAPAATLPLHLANDVGLGPLNLLCQIEGEGTSTLQMIQYATLAIRQGMARRVVCVFSDARVQGGDTAAAYAKPMELTGIPGWEAHHGILGALGAYALQASGYLERHQLDAAAFGHYAIACRRWAMRNPQAVSREELSMETYLASRAIVEPLRLLDCAFPVNGAAAVVVESATAAGRNGHAPVLVHGMGQGHAGDDGLGHHEPASGGTQAAQSALAMAGITRAQVAQLQAYDPFSSVGLQLLEAYGFCAAGEAAEFVRSGATSPGGRLPMNTGGGHLSGFYLQGMTPLIEAVIQLRGLAGERQCRKGAALVTGIGGCLEYHASLVLGGRELH
jgi:acetyl-CoA acetyltransferase